MKLIERFMKWAWNRKRDEASTRELREAARELIQDQGRADARGAPENMMRATKDTARRAHEHEEHVPGTQGKVARSLFDTLVREFDPRHLSFGGGTVLAARWKHRESHDVDLFCQTDVFAGLGRDARIRIEERVKKIGGCDPDVTWCENIGLYTEINGIEATVLPRAQVMPERRNTVLEGTSLKLQASDEILYAKIVHRMYEAQEITVRDAYDVACARLEDPDTLNRAVGRIDEDIVHDVIATISNLPKGWTQDEQKSLVNPKYEWSEKELGARTVTALADASEKESEQRRGRSIG